MLVSMFGIRPIISISFDRICVRIGPVKLNPTKSGGDCRILIARRIAAA
jgi:hypothetical protein